MNLTPRQQEIVVRVANWLNRAMPESPLVVVPRWRLQELKHEEVYSDSPARDLDWYKRFWMGLIVRLIVSLIAANRGRWERVTELRLGHLEGQAKGR
jgi:hypothetical protein